MHMGATMPQAAYYTAILVEGPVEPDSAISGRPPADVSRPCSTIQRIKIPQSIDPQRRTTSSGGRVELQLSEAEASRDTLHLAISKVTGGS
jgi:hypothetical protein